MTINQTLTTEATAEKPRQLHARINFAIFAIVVVGIGWVGVAIDRAGGVAAGTGSETSTSGSTNGQGLWILLPALTALVLYFLSRDGGGRLGLTLRFRHQVRWFGFAVAFSPVQTALTVLAGTALGIATFHFASAPGKPALLASLVSGLGFMAIKNVIEEFIFRGYGTRTAMAAGLRGVRAHLLVGVVWGMWHLPLYLVWTAAADRHMVTSLKWALFFPMFFVGVILLAIVLGELRVQTGSIWPGVVLHTIAGVITLPLLANGNLTFSGHADALVGLSPASIASMIIIGAAGWLLVRRRHQAVVQAQGGEP